MNFIVAQFEKELQQAARLFDERKLAHNADIAAINSLEEKSFILRFGFNFNLKKKHVFYFFVNYTFN